MPSFELEPVEGGNRVKISGEKITIGRGPLLQVTDKRVSRNHATLEVTDGQLILVPIHTNPCFFKSQGKGEKTNLKKDAAKVLQHGDVFGLLPDKLFYRVFIKGMENGKSSNREVKKESESSKKPKGGRVKVKAASAEAAGRGEMTLPLDRGRELPKWMKGASKRMGTGMPVRKQTTPAKRQTAPNARVRSPRKKAPPVEDFDDFEEDEDSPPRPKKRAATKRKAREASESEEEFSDYTEKKPARRAGRAASQKVTTYTDDFVLSDEEVEFSDDVSEPRGHGSGHKASSDEEFKLDDESSASDWEEETVKKPSRSAKSSKKAGGGGGRGGRRRRSSGGATRRSSRTSSKRRKRYAESESDEFDDYYDDEDNYIPRPSRRRAAQKAESEELEDEEPQVKKSKKEPRPSCMYGRKCYRKNPGHFTEFCHPGDNSYDEEEAKESKAEYQSDPSSSEGEEGSGKESPAKKKKETPTKKPLREKDKKSVLHKASDDDGEPNTYDYDDSFLDEGRKRPESASQDSGELSSSEEEDVKRLVKEARGFLRTKKTEKV